MAEDLVIISEGGSFGRKAHTYPYATSALLQQYPVLPPSMDKQPTRTISSRKKISFSIKTPLSCCENLKKYKKTKWDQREKNPQNQKNEKKWKGLIHR